MNQNPEAYGKGNSHDIEGLEIILRKTMSKNIGTNRIKQISSEVISEQ